MGRLFTKEEEQFGEDTMCLAQLRLVAAPLGDRDIVGRDIKLGGENYTVAE